MCSAIIRWEVGGIQCLTPLTSLSLSLLLDLYMVERGEEELFKDKEMDFILSLLKFLPPNQYGQLLISWYTPLYIYLLNCICLLYFFLTLTQTYTHVPSSWLLKFFQWKRSVFKPQQKPKCQILISKMSCLVSLGRWAKQNIPNPIISFWFCTVKTKFGK